MKQISDKNGKTFSQSVSILKDKENYATWAFSMKCQLKSVGLYAVIVDDQRAQSDLDDKRKSDGAEDLSLLLSCISELEISKIHHCSTANQVWSFFETAYGQKTTNIKLELLNELNKIKIASAGRVSSAISNAMTIKGKLDELEVKVDDNMILSSNNASMFSLIGRPRRMYCVSVMGLPLNIFFVSSKSCHGLGEGSTRLLRFRN